MFNLPFTPIFRLISGTSLFVYIFFFVKSKLFVYICRQDDPQELTTIYATWTPKHNGVLKDCLEHNPRSENESDQLFLARIAKSWRSKFPKSSVTDEDLTKKIVDSLHIKDPNAVAVDQGSGALEGMIFYYILFTRFDDQLFVYIYFRSNHTGQENEIRSYQNKSGS